MKGRNTIEQIFILRYIIEQACEWQSPLLANFIDFEKTFDLLHHNSLWVIMRAYGIPEKLINIVKLLFNNAECTVLDNGQMSGWFKVKTGVKQGSMMTGFLFTLAVDWVMCQTTTGADTGI